MTKTILCLAAVLIAATGFSQLTTTPSGGNKKATVGERIGLTDVTIHYDRPGVKGREGKIWGGLVYTGFSNLGFGTAKASPWRAGSNESTRMTFSTDVLINGQPLAAGTYGFFIAYDPNESTLIFSKNSTSWGSFYYDEKDDVLRVKTKPTPLDKSVEWLRYEFMNETDSTATIALEWEKLSIPFNVQVDVAKAQIQSFRDELKTPKGYNYLGWIQAAQWCIAHNVNLDEALLWADSASGPTFGGDNQFQALATKAQVLAALNRTDEAMAVMKIATPLGSKSELHQYARQLIVYKKPKEALEVFKYNAQKHPKDFMVLVGLARGYSANGDYKTALKYALQAQPLAPDQINKTSMEAIVSKLQAGKDVN